MVNWIISNTWFPLTVCKDEQVEQNYQSFKYYLTVCKEIRSSSFKNNVTYKLFLYKSCLFKTGFGIDWFLCFMAYQLFRLFNAKAILLEEQ